MQLTVQAVSYDIAMYIIFKIIFCIFFVHNIIFILINDNKI